MTLDPITKAIEALELECERTGPECHTQTVEALTALRQHNNDNRLRDIQEKVQKLCDEKHSISIETLDYATGYAHALIAVMKIIKETDDERA